MKSGLVVEDIAATRRWLCEALDRAFPGIMVESASTQAQALAVIPHQRFDVALVDLDLPDGSGLEVISLLRRLSPSTIPVVTTIFDDEAHVFPAMQAGAQGYLLKEQPQAQFISGLRGILEGNPPLSPAIARRMIAHFMAVPSPAAEPGVALTPRETEVLRLIAKGFTQTEIATQLGLSRHTVIDYVKSLYRKLDVSSRAEATLAAARRGLVR